MQSSISQQLALMQLSDSFLPTGSFTLSHGLETLVQTGQIDSASALQTFIRILLRKKVGVTDTVALIYGHRGIQADNLDAVRQADRQLFVQTAISKNRTTQRQSGRALLMVASQTWQDERLDILNREAAQGTIHGLHPVIFGAIAAVAGLNERDTGLAFLHGFVTSILGAAIRLGVLGHIQAQQILLQLAPDIEAAWSTAAAMQLEQMWSCTPSIDIAQMQHPKLRQRLFAN
ncbi:Urease accessory protein ureF [[Leptolyngbya] sp. PCC 7376]|uniref:urease accessory protein UreF n=1 Tax=[Leptolyngbya] sp. PCC 7376 TaxID=111781 RepID=UPI00029ECD2A|nr:urease accessory UreF family protein [[Leptolyngbya] sp. PCC 7376]AFY36703.1 Urease accessory protein ureF [[Leptolyngbya] sp. PCC 7376]